MAKPADIVARICGDDAGDGDQTFSFCLLGVGISVRMRRLYHDRRRYR